MDLKKIFLSIISFLACTFFSCAHDEFLQEELVYDIDSIIHNNTNIIDSTNVDSIKTDSINKDDDKSNVTDSIFTEIDSKTVISGFEKYMDQSSSGSVQGAASFGDYLFQFQHANAAVYIYNLAEKTFVKKITLTANSNNHCNQASFSNTYYHEEDSFPLLYVSGSQNTSYNHVQVYRIIGQNENIVIQQIQEIVLPKNYNSNKISATCIIMDNDNNCLYAYANSSSARLIKFKTPDFHQEAVDLTDADILDYVSIGHIDHQQGGIIKNGILYMIFGVPAWGDIVWLRLFNLETKSEIARFNLSEKGFKGEPESVFFYKNDLFAVTNNSGIFKFLITKD